MTTANDCVPLGGLPHVNGGEVLAPSQVCWWLRMPLLTPALLSSKLAVLRLGTMIVLSALLGLDSAAEMR